MRSSAWPENAAAAAAAMSAEIFLRPRAPRPRTLCYSLPGAAALWPGPRRPTGVQTEEEEEKGEGAGSQNSSAGAGERLMRSRMYYHMLSSAWPENAAAAAMSARIFPASRAQTTNVVL